MLRRRAQSDERRRRVLTDDAANDASRSTSGKRKSSAKKARYGSDALDKQVRISDLVPRRAWIHPLLFLAATLVGGSLVALHHWQHTHSRADLGILDLTVPGNLAGWLSSLCLALAAGMALICYSLRRHRQSDYHTRYRVWLWIAGAMVMMSAASTTAWHVTAAAVFASTTGWIPPIGVSVIWLAPAALCLATLAIRLLLELRGCRVATIGVIAATLAYAVVFAFAIGLELSLSAPVVAMVVHGSQLFGHTVLLFSFLWYARYVVLDIQGLVPIKEASAAANKKKKAERRRIDKAHKESPPPKGRSDLEPDMQTTRHSVKIVADEDYEDDFTERASSRAKSKRNNRSRNRQQESEYDEYDDEPQQRQQQMSKAQRKRQRKLKARQRDAA